MTDHVIFHQGHLLRDDFPTLPSLYYGFRNEFSTARETTRFNTALAECFQEFMSIRRCMFDARDRRESARLDCRYLEFVSVCLYLDEVTPDNAIRLPRDDHYAGFVHTAPWWMELNDLAESLSGTERRIYLERLQRCDAELTRQLTCLSRINKRATEAEREATARRNELMARMTERGIHPEQLKRLWKAS